MILYPSGSQLGVGVSIGVRKGVPADARIFEVSSQRNVNVKVQ